jgi:hypothetical protein
VNASIAHELMCFVWFRRELSFSITDDGTLATSVECSAIPGMLWPHGVTIVEVLGFADRVSSNET